MAEKTITIDVRVEPSLELDHQTMVNVLLKSGQDVLDSLTPMKCDISHAAYGIGTECGELMDAVKKHIYYNREIDRANVVEELGDLEFYMQALRSRLNITREETLKHNMEKLAERYKDYKYSDKAATDRADKNK
jgi:NTP pyrophosphatase (non-canonical NTP hydrolase)